MLVLILYFSGALDYGVAGLNIQHIIFIIIFVLKVMIFQFIEYIDWWKLVQGELKLYFTTQLSTDQLRKYSCTGNLEQYSNCLSY